MEIGWRELKELREIQRQGEVVEEMGLVPIEDTRWDTIVEAGIKLVVDTVDSLAAKQYYELDLRQFFRFCDGQGRPPLSKALVESYKDYLLTERDYSRNTINRKLTPVRKLAYEAADNGLLAPHVAAAIGRVKNVKVLGHPKRVWLTEEQAQKLLDAADCSGLIGLRDRALIATLLGTGIRADEARRLTFGHIQLYRGRWAIVNIVGKYHHIRTVPMPNWTKRTIDDWATAANISDGYVFRRFAQGSKNKLDPDNEQLKTSAAIHSIVTKYADPLDLPVPVAPHSCRRTFAELSLSGDDVTLEELRQLQLTLGHCSVRTTEIYLDREQDFDNAPCDRLGIGIEPNGQE